jgi:hypothetical protein
MAKINLGNFGNVMAHAELRANVSQNLSACCMAQYQSASSYDETSLKHARY